MKHRDDLAALRQSYAKLEKEFNAIADKQKLPQNRSAQYDPVHSPLGRRSVTSGSNDEAASEPLGQIQQHAEIISSTGLDQLASSEGLDPTILSKIYEDYALRDSVSSYRQQILERNRELHQSDRNQYNEELMALYERARIRPGQGNAEDREEAFKELLTKFPDAYATGMAIAERGLMSAFMRKNQDVEEYYVMLNENDKFSDIVTDWGAEAMPNLENYLANSYIGEGRIEEALVFIESLESKYPDSFVLTRGDGFRPKWLPASQAAENLRMLIE
jgi:hypothetical protein